MKPEVAHRRIESFGKRFGEAHLVFAYHAAFPLALTADLLYKLWANFQRDIHGRVLRIPWVAVADLLLSSLCDEVGHELYEIDTGVRNILLSRLKENVNFGQQRINELSNFLLVYVRKQLNSSDQNMRDFAQVQRWTALAYVRPSEVAHELRLALKQVQNQDRSEQVRLASLVETFAEPLAEFEPLLVYAQEINKFARINRRSQNPLSEPNLDTSLQSTDNIKHEQTRSINAGTTEGELLAGRYLLYKLLGRGRFGETFLAKDQWQPQTSLCVVKKIMLPSNEPEVLEKARMRFEREAEALKKLGTHPQIPELYNYFEINKAFYLIEEFIDGITLRQEFEKREPWNEYQVIKLLKEILKILEFVHQEGIIHRDVNPKNLIRRKSDGKLVLIDFAAIEDTLNRLSRNMSIAMTIVTLGYMPNEQAGGSPKLCSDIYAVGIMGIQALTGTLPYQLEEDPETGEFIWKHLVKISKPFEIVLEKMVRAYFRDRYQSATEALAALNALT